MIKPIFTAIALAAALCAGGAAQAALVTFDDPGTVEIDNITNVATYTEAGFTITGQAASFLPIDMFLVGGFDTTSFSLMQAGGGAFSLLSLDYAPYDLGFGDATSTLTITGLLGGSPVATQMVNLAGSERLMFGIAWAQVSEISFTGTAGFSLDNISAVPEPGTLVLSSLGLLGLGLRRLHRQRTA